MIKFVLNQAQIALHRKNPDKYKKPSGPPINDGRMMPNEDDEMRLARHLYEKIQLDDIQENFKVDRGTAKRLHNHMLQYNVDMTTMLSQGLTKM
jgi:hypothetical protein